MPCGKFQPFLVEEFLEPSEDLPLDHELVPRLGLEFNPHDQGGVIKRQHAGAPDPTWVLSF